MGDDRPDDEPSEEHTTPEAGAPSADSDSDDDRDSETDPEVDVDDEAGRDDHEANQSGDDPSDGTDATADPDDTADRSTDDDREDAENPWGFLAADPDEREDESRSEGSSTRTESESTETDAIEERERDGSDEAASESEVVDAPVSETVTEPSGDPVTAVGPESGVADDEPDEPWVYSRSGPAEDQEMPLTEHIREMVQRLAVVVTVASVVTLVTFPFADQLVTFLWFSILPGTEVARPRLYGILELLMTKIKVASLAGFIMALPVFVYETYQFMRPGLYPHERRYYLAAIPTSLVLALIGVGFAFFIILPAIFTYFLYYSQDVATIGFALMKTFDLILLLMGYLALVFQIPLFIMLAMMMGLVTRRWLADRRLLFWGGFLGLSFLFSPDPTGMAPIIVTLTMIALFEGTLLLTKWTRRGRAQPR